MLQTHQFFESFRCPLVGKPFLMVVNPFLDPHFSSVALNLPDDSVGISGSAPARISPRLRSFRPSFLVPSSFNFGQ